MWNDENVAAWMIAGGPGRDATSAGLGRWLRATVRRALRTPTAQLKADGTRGRAGEPACCPA